jgi:hypothetical protein
MEILVYGKTLRSRVVEQKITNVAPRVWRDATGFTIIKAGNIEVNLTAQDIHRLHLCSQKGAVAV